MTQAIDEREARKQYVRRRQKVVFSIIGALLWNRFTPESLHVSQDIQPLGYVGCACILVAIVLSQLNFRSRAKTVAHSSTVHHAGK